MGGSRMDDIDRKLLRALIDDARLSYQQLAALVHLSSNSTADRVRRLRQSGVIEGFHAELNMTSLDRTLHSLTGTISNGAWREYPRSCTSPTRPANSTTNFESAVERPTSSSRWWTRCATSERATSRVESCWARSSTTRLDCCSPDGALVTPNPDSRADGGVGCG